MEKSRCTCGTPLGGCSARAVVLSWRRVPHVQIIFDSYHVQRLVSDALDETRREEWQRLKDEFPDDAADVKGLRWPTLKNPWNFTPTQR